jgi:hypothetical protein
MRMRNKNALVVLALLWVVLVALVVQAARNGEVSTPQTIVMVVALTIVVPIFWRMFRRRA